MTYHTELKWTDAMAAPPYVTARIGKPGRWYPREIDAIAGVIVRREDDPADGRGSLNRTHPDLIVRVRDGSEVSVSCHGSKLAALAFREDPQPGNTIVVVTELRRGVRSYEMSSTDWSAVEAEGDDVPHLPPDGGNGRRTPPGRR